jgi:WD40 repeat protein
MTPSAGVVHGSCDSVGVNLPAGRHRARRSVVIFSTDDTVRVWGLATGQPIGAQFTGHAVAVDAVAAAHLDGRPVVVSGSWDSTMRVWDLATGQPIGAPFTGHDAVVSQCLWPPRVGRGSRVRDSGPAARR